jgi:hypothetical protein
MHGVLWWSTPMPVDPLEPRRPFPRWLFIVLGLIAVLLVPWTLWLTFALPTRHVSTHYDIAWVGFDVVLAAAFAATAFAAFRAATWLQPLAVMTGTMLLCDAWFDTVTSSSRDERVLAILEAVCAELPLAALCGWIVLDTKRFHDAAARWYLEASRRRQSSVADPPATDL